MDGPSTPRYPLVQPLPVEGGHSQETLNVLQHRLVSAEEDAKNLVDQLATMSFKSSRDGNSLQQSSQSTAGGSTVTPYKVRSADADTLHQNYESLVSRVCRMESSIQTMKLSLLRAQAELDLNKQQKISANEKLSVTADAYEKELNKLSRDLVQSRKDCKEAQEERRRAQDDVRRLQEELDVATSGKSEASIILEDLKVSKQKLSRRVNELREEVARESSLRASLEDSHNTLLGRIQDMEDVVIKEQDELKILNTNCSGLKRECVRATEEAKRERLLRQQAEEQIKKMMSQSESYGGKLQSLEEDKAYLMGETNKMRTRYNELIQQLDQTQKLVDDKQETREQLEKENKRLYEAMKSAASQNAQLIAKYEQELEAGRTELIGKVQGEEHLKHLEEKLRTESREKGHALSSCAQLEAQVVELQEKLQRCESDLEEKTAQHKTDVGGLRKSLRAKETDKEQIIRDKDTLLDEVNQAVDEMADERSRLQGQLQQAQLDLQTMQQTNKHLEQENGRLLERLSAVEEQAAASGQVEKAMATMLDQKNKLAYEKGRLQNGVKELQQEVERLASAQSELSQSRKMTTTLESSYKKCQAELNSCRMTIQRLESQLKQAQSSGERKEEDFRLAIQARDEALKEGQRLLQHVEAIEDRERQKVLGMKRNLGDARDDNKKVAGTLESVMQSHSRLELMVEGLQVDLGRKDSQINKLTNEKTESQHAMRQLQKELDNLQSNLVSMETLEASEIEPLRGALQQCKSDNAKMAASLETVVRSNGQLQANMETLQDHLEKKAYVLEQLQNARETEAEEHKQEMQVYEERMDNLKQRLAKEREKALKKGSKEVAEVRKELEELLTKNGELARANTELRHKVTEQEYLSREQKEKIASQRSQIDHLTRIRQKQDDSLRSLQGINDQLEALEHTNNDYVKRNAQQAKTISKFMSRMSSLQGELQNLAQTQADTAAILQQQEEQLKQERRRNDDLRRKYKVKQDAASRKREAELEDLRHRTEEKVHEANKESLEISTSLSDAHEWFKSKFDTLQDELIKSRQLQPAPHHLEEFGKLQEELSKSRRNQAGLITENYEQKQLLECERQKAEDTAEKARQMIKASRETISRLADFAEVNQHETSKQLWGMKKELQAERDYSKFTESKLKGIQESSLRHTEQLAQELDFIKSHSAYDSLTSDIH